MTQTSIEIVAAQIVNQLTVEEAREVSRGNGYEILAGYKVGTIMTTRNDAARLVETIRTICCENILAS